MSTSCSYVSLKKGKALEIAALTIQKIEKYRECQTRKVIDEEREYLTKRWWRRLLKKPIPSDEEVLKHIKETTTVWTNPLTEIQEEFSNSERIAREIINAVEYIGDDDVVNVTLSDLSYIG